MICMSQNAFEGTMGAKSYRNRIGIFIYSYDFTTQFLRNFIESIKKIREIVRVYKNSNAASIRLWAHYGGGYIINGSFDSLCMYRVVKMTRQGKL